jgi:hypothetical protein
VRSRSQADEKNPGGRVSEGRHGTSPILPVLVSAALSLRDKTAMIEQTGALLASHNLLLKHGERMHLPLVPRFVISGVQKGGMITALAGWRGCVDVNR